MSKRLIFTFSMALLLCGYGYTSLQKKEVSKTKECLAMIYNAQKNYKVHNQTYADSLSKLNLQFPRACQGLNLSLKSGTYQFSVTARNNLSGEWETNHRKQIIRRF